MVALVEIPSELDRADLEKRLPQPGSRFEDLTGREFSRGKVIGLAGWIGKYSYWLVECSSGHQSIKSVSQVKLDVTCGECHFLGYSAHPLYHTWAHIRHNELLASRWRDFKCFADDIGPRPSASHVLSRMDRNKGFEPGNYCWMLWKTSARNRTDLSWYEHNGERLLAADWALRVGVTRSRMEQRLSQCKRHGVPVAEAITTPAGCTMPSFASTQACSRAKE